MKKQPITTTETKQNCESGAIMFAVFAVVMATFTLIELFR